MTRPPTMSRSAEVVAGAALMAIAVLLGIIGNRITATSGGLDRGVLLTGLVFAAAGALLLLAWLAHRGWRQGVDAASFGIVAVALTIFVASYFAAELRTILYRADMLIWSESPFINDIIRVRAGMPLFGSPEDLSSFYYPPGTQLLTYWIVSLVGLGESVPAMRVVQVGYVLAAVPLGVRAARRLRELSGQATVGLPWAIVWTPLLFLAATNSLTNRFTHLLHNDALGLLVCAAAFYVVVEYAAAPRTALLVAMVLLPPIGFLVKQSLGIWCVLFGAWLLVFGPRPRFRRSVIVGGAGLVIILLLSAGGQALWGDNFRFWFFEGLGKHAVSPLRSIKHFLDGWAYWAAGLWGCWLLVRGERATQLFGLWLVFALLFAVETYTSGIAWMLNHMGPGSFLATVWLCAAVPSIWPSPHEGKGVWTWLRAGLVTAMAILFLSGLSAIHIPSPTLPPDADRYVAAIEREFEGKQPAKVLLDNGSWLYLPHNIVQYDRSSVAGEAGWTQSVTFSGMIDRLRRREYDRILVRDLNDEEFMYDYALWEKSSGVRDSLLTYYRVVRTIPAVPNLSDPWLREISVLEPKAPPDPSGGAPQQSLPPVR